MRPMSEEDFEDIFKIFSDKKVLKAFNLKDFSQEQMKGWINRNLTHQEKFGYGEGGQTSIRQLTFDSLSMNRIQ